MSISKHSLYNLVGTLIPLAISLVAIPLYLGVIGEERYGVLAIAWMLLGYFGLFDLGLGQATAQAIASLREDAAECRARVFWTALYLNVSLGVIGGIIIWPFASYYFGHAFNVDQALRAEVLSAVPWLILAVPIATLSGVLIGGLQGRDKFLELNVISVGSSVIFQLLPLMAAAIFGPDLRILIPAVLIARATTLVALCLRCHVHLTRGYPLKADASRARKLLNYGGWVTVTSFVGPLMSLADRFVIGSLSGAKAVTHYTVPFQLAERGNIFSVAVTSAMFPRVCSATVEEVPTLTAKALRMLSAIMTVVICAGIFLMEPFLGWWINVQFASHATVVGQIILVGMWFNGLARVPFIQLTARGRPDLTAAVHLVEVLPYFLMLYLGIRYFGIVGAASAFTARVFLDLVLLSKLARVLPLTAKLLWLPFLIVSASLAIAQMNFPSALSQNGLIVLHLSFTTIWALQRAPELLSKARSLQQLVIRL